MKTLFLIDAHALIHRAFHALPPLTTPGGEPIGAIYGLASIILKLFRTETPDYVAVALDRPEPTFRKEEFPEYKAHRPKAADELVSQLVKARELFAKFGISMFERPGFEADDIIGTLVELFKKEKDLKIVILTGDLDTLQLVHGQQIIVRTPQKGASETKIYDEAAVFERYGLAPDQMTDYKGLVGDASDNIPGVPGIGPKTAAKLLSQHHDLETLYKKIQPDSPFTKKILANKKQALFSKKLATINRAVPLEVNLNQLVYAGPDHETLVRYFTELGFQSLIQRILSQGNLFESRGPFTETNIPENALIIKNFDSVLEKAEELSSKKIKIAFDWKPILKEMEKHGLRAADPLFDAKIAGWLLDPGQKDFSLEALVKRFLRRNREEDDYKDIGELFSFLNGQLKKYELNYVFEKIEMPLIRILAAMENWGIAVDTKKLKALRQKLNDEIDNLAEKIYTEAGVRFNINSPTQVAEIVFEKLKIKTERVRKTATGKRSTTEKTLEELKNKHSIINLILEYRENFKIKSTYAEPLIKLAGKDSKIRTSFLQTGTATGRLSSEKPNLQNIPQESKWSKPLRQAFVSKPGFSFLSFDYSQLELRLLAHVSGDEKLRAAFLNKQDVHKLTAAQIFNTPFGEVKPWMRRIGKTLNFGTVYGMGARAFSQTSGLSLKEAQKFIDEYFNDFPKIKLWQKNVKAEAKTLGFVKNLNGRRRWFLNAATGGPQADYEMERAAINMPIQSLGADILKLAMIECFAALKKMNSEKRGTNKDQEKTKLLLSIHDELLFEISDDILKETAPLIKNIMEKIYALSVPLTVETKTGKNWGEMKSFV
ncbi:MAG: DNA polymerase [Patescibacteria group bacterium]